MFLSKLVGTMADFLSSLRIKPFDDWLQVEVSAVCNTACSYCAYNQLSLLNAVERRRGSASTLASVGSVLESKRIYRVRNVISSPNSKNSKGGSPLGQNSISDY
jgi:hypothetical protein